MSSLYPVYIKLAGKSALIVGAGSAASQKVRGLRDAGAAVRLVSPVLDAELESLRSDGAFQWIERPFEDGDLDGVFLVVVTTSDARTSRQVFELAEARRILCNAVDQDAFSSFHAPAIVRRGGIQAAISTAGQSPAFASHLRERLSAAISENDGRFAAFLGGLRPRVQARFPADAERRKRIFQALCGAYRHGSPPGGSRLPITAARAGKVYLVGAGPGDHGLLTLRGASLLMTADAVYHDRLVGEQVLGWISPAAERIYVGRESAARSPDAAASTDPPPPATGDLLVAAARRGRAVVRLKGGDPTLFGRGGEEMSTLLQAGIDFEVVPGVSALTAVPAAAGVPLTHRRLSHQVIARSGYREIDPATGRLAPPASGETTYVYFMTAGRLTEIVAELREAEGLSDETPVAIIQRGTLPGQSVTTGRLADIIGIAARTPIHPPALVVAGEVVRFADRSELLEYLDRKSFQQDQPTQQRPPCAPSTRR